MASLGEGEGMMKAMLVLGVERLKEKKKVPLFEIYII